MTAGAKQVGHTPGPWKAHAESLSDNRLTVSGPVLNQRICYVVTPEPRGYAERDKNAEANARLIAAAPELLEALKWAAEMMGYATYQLKPEWRSKNGGDFDDAMSQAREAIAKAEGL